MFNQEKLEKAKVEVKRFMKAEAGSHDIYTGYAKFTLSKIIAPRAAWEVGVSVSETHLLRAVQQSEFCFTAEELKAGAIEVAKEAGFRDDAPIQEYLKSYTGHDAKQVKRQASQPSLF